MIEIQSFNPRWRDSFEEIKARVWPKLQGIAISMEHVGSTSVPGLQAKPVIDIAIIVETRETVTEAIQKLSELGYEHRGDLGIKDREAFKAPKPSIQHNLYVAIQGSLSLKNHLLLKKYLTENGEARDQYSKLKLELAKQFPNDVDLYCAGKTSFILSILKNVGMTESELKEIADANRVFNKVIAQTERLILREIDYIDLNFFSDIFSSPENMKYYPSLRSREETRSWIGFNHEHYDRYGYGKWALVHKSDGVLIGHSGLIMTEIDGEFEPELGYFLDQHFWGHGYATEAAGACLNFAFSDLKMDRIVSAINPTNLPSVKVASRLGMKREKFGKARVGSFTWECDIYALTKGER